MPVWQFDVCYFFYLKINVLKYICFMSLCFVNKCFSFLYDINFANSMFDFDEGSQIPRFWVLSYHGSPPTMFVSNPKPNIPEEWNAKSWQEVRQRLNRAKTWLQIFCNFICLWQQTLAHSACLQCKWEYTGDCRRVDMGGGTVGMIASCCNDLIVIGLGMQKVYWNSTL